MLTPTKPVKSCECGSPCGDCCGCTKESIGLGNVDNTSDLNKPLSTAMINALSGKVDLDTFTQLKNRVLALENSIPDITDLEHRMDEAEDDILGLNAGYTALHNTVLSMADSITELGGRVTEVTNDIVTLDTGKADKATTYTKTEVDAYLSLKANDSAVVHKSGNETISGAKTFTGQMLATGQRAYLANNTTDVATIGTLDAYTPMVRTSGNQDISGNKTFTNGVTIKTYQAITVAPTAGPTIGVNTAATQNILSLYQRQGDSTFVTRDTIYQGANTRNISRLWYLQRQNEAGTGIEQASLALTFTSEGRATLTITDSQGTRTII